jgi:hypothetical protein
LVRCSDVGLKTGRDIWPPTGKNPAQVPMKWALALENSSAEKKYLHVRPLPNRAGFIFEQGQVVMRTRPSTAN